MEHDAIVIGGSFAGLSAAIHIARARRSVCVVDAGNPRNRFADASHGFFGQDGSDPRAMIAGARAQLQRYPTVRTVPGEAVAASAIAGGFEVTLASGERLTAAKLVLAFGISDVLPEMPGLAERWGKSVLHCPYCHGFEFSGQPLGVLQTMPMSAHQALLIADWGPTTLYLNGVEAPDADIERIAFDALSAWPAPEMTRLSPMGTVPILETENGTLIRSSVAILEYLEERFPSPDLLGATPEARARTRELVSVIDEAAIYFGIWCRQASPLFAGRGQQNREAATMAADVYHVRLRQLDALIGETEGPFLAGQHVTIADCIATATLQFAEHCYGVPVPNYDRLASWYAYFGTRPSATLPAYPQPVLALAYGLPSVCPPTSI